jgi:hypothetical protein
MENDGTTDHLELTEAALEHLPEKWKENIVQLKEKGLGLLEAADPEIQNLIRLVHAFPSSASLRFIQNRLWTTRFEPTMDWVFENDMLILAFVTTYARLVEGGVATGVKKGALPAELRPVHDQIMELRNKRYAHNAGHSSVEGNVEIGFDGAKFDVNIRFEMQFHVGGAAEWGKLAKVIDQIMFERLQGILRRLKTKTGLDWVFPMGDAPPWILERATE